MVFVVLIVFRRRLPFRKDARFLCIALALTAFLWGLLVYRSWGVIAGGYLGSKILPVLHTAPQDSMKTLWLYIGKTAGMFHIRGDGLFRVNIPGSPQLDPVSGVLLIIGIIWLGLRGYGRMLLSLGIASVIYILPSISPAIPAGEVPSSGRTIGILPFVYVLTAAGLPAVYTGIKRYSPPGYLYPHCCCISYMQI